MKKKGFDLNNIHCVQGVYVGISHAETKLNWHTRQWSIKKAPVPGMIFRYNIEEGEN